MTNITNPDTFESPSLSSTIQDYLSLIYVMERDNEPVVGSHLAELLGVSPPTVTNTLKRMTRDGLITMNKDGTHLTEYGWDAARVVMRRHMLMELLMALILPWSKLHTEAHQLEHAVSSLTETALMEELGWLGPDSGWAGRRLVLRRSGLFSSTKQPTHSRLIKKEKL